MNFVYIKYLKIIMAIGYAQIKYMNNKIANFKFRLPNMIKII